MEPKTLADFILNRGLAEVTRYHSTPRRHDESVPEHSHYVTLFSDVLCDILEEKGKKIDRIDVLEKSLVHDMEEMYSGDIKHPFKNANPKLKKLIEDQAKMLIGKAFEGLPEKTAKRFKKRWDDYHDVTKSKSIENIIVEVADTLSLVSYCLEEMRAGNQRMTEIYNNGMKRLKSYNYSWLKPVLLKIEKEKSIVVK